MVKTEQPFRKHKFPQFPVSIVYYPQSLRAFRVPQDTCPCVSLIVFGSSKMLFCVLKVVMSEKLLCFEPKSHQTNLLWPSSYHNKRPQHFITAGKTILVSNNPEITTTTKEPVCCAHEIYRNAREDNHVMLLRYAIMCVELLKLSTNQIPTTELDKGFWNHCWSQLCRVKMESSV